MLTDIILRLRSLFRRTAIDQEVDDELRFHLDREVEAYVTAGIDRTEAVRRARLAFGGLDQIKEDYRDASGIRVLEDLTRDLRYAFTQLRRAPGFALTVVLTLALGIGANVTMFSIMRAVLWRPLPYPDGERLVVIDADFGPVRSAGLAPGELLDLAAASRMFQQVATANGVDAFLTVDDNLERVAAASASDDMLTLLGGVPMALGRPLQAAVDVQQGRAVAVVISDGLWQRGFHRDPSVVGRHLQVNDQDVQIVGVLAPDLRVWLPAAAGVDEQVDVWFPERWTPTRRERGPAAIARLADGATLEAGQAELDGLSARFLADHAADYSDAIGPLRLRVRPLREVVAAPVTSGLIALGAAVGFVLLIGCVNIAHLMLARTATREREIAIRIALGASRSRIIRQLLCELLVLAAAGGAGGLLLADIAIGGLGWLRSVQLPRQSAIAIDSTVALVAVGLAVATTLVCGLIPALRLSRGRGSLTPTSVRAVVSLAGRRRLQRLMVVAEVALSIVPLVAAGLMLRTFVNLTNVPLGFEPAHVLTARVPVSLRRFPDVRTRWSVYREAVNAAGRLPGIEGVSAISAVPFGPGQVGRRFRREGDPTGPGFAASQQAIAPGYLRLTGTPLLGGREFSAEDLDDQHDVAIIDGRFARALGSQSENAIGMHVLVGGGARLRALEVIGVTDTVRVARLRDEPLPHIFVPYHLSPVELTLVVKTDGDERTVGPAIKQAIEALGTTRAVHDIRPMESYVHDALDDTRFAMIVLAAFALASLLLAAIGLYGTLTYVIGQRSPEFGVRLALGASTRHIVGLVAAEGAALTAIGLGVGLAGALAVTRTLAGMLYGVTPLDRLTLGSVAALMSLIAIIAASQPAWRVAHLDPSQVLRGE